MDTEAKLGLLADASRFDLACACGTEKGDDHRRRGEDGRWLYPVSLPRGGTGILLKTLLTNACQNDCRYCPFRASQDIPRASLKPEEVAGVFMEYVQRHKVMGLFLSSGVVRSPDFTMDRIVAVAHILRRNHGYRGFLHLKVVPGASDAAIEEAVSLAQAVSINLEVPRPSHMKVLSERKRFEDDLVRPMKRIAQLTGPGSRYARVKQTTQFIVGAADERDADLVEATARLYRRWRLSRVYFSAYQRGFGDASLPGERDAVQPQDLLTREHRLYQVDWLLRKYGFSAEEIPFEEDGQLSLRADPKETWALRHPAFFPVDVNTADRYELLRVPGFGERTVQRLLTLRARGGRIASLRALGKPDRRLQRAVPFIRFGG